MLRLDLGRDELAKAFHRPHVHDGTFSTFRGRRFGAPADHVAPEHFVVFSTNHDQVTSAKKGSSPMSVSSGACAKHTTRNSPAQASGDTA